VALKWRAKRVRLAGSGAVWTLVMPYSFTLVSTVPASSEAIYDAWLDSAGHSAMTGAKAKASDKVGAAFTAWDGYIWGKNLELVRGERIVQSWRTTQFSDADPDSILTVTLAPIADGAELTLVHSNVPDGHKGYEEGGWEDNYFAPMKAYFGGKSQR
jgi:activator of HSP90 ATPase